MMTQKGVLLLVTVVLTCLAGAAYVVWGGSATRESQYAEQLDVQEHELVRRFDEKGLNSIYIGPPTVGIPALTGPQLVLNPPQPNFSDALYEHAASGSGQLGDGTECRVDVYRVKQNVQPFSTWRLNREQIQRVQTGRAEVLQVVTRCAPFDT